MSWFTDNAMAGPVAPASATLPLITGQTVDGATAPYYGGAPVSTPTNTPATGPGSWFAKNTPPPSKFGSMVGQTVPLGSVGTVAGVPTTAMASATNPATEPTSVTGGGSSAFTPTGNYSSSTNVQQMLTAANAIANPGTTVSPSDVSYWQSQMAGDNGAHPLSYWYDRMQGMDAGPQDFAKAGPYANGQGYTVPTSAGGGTGFENPATQPFTYPNWTGSFSYPGFQAPTAAQAQQQPGYQFGLKQGEQGYQQAAAANGTLLTTGTLEGLNNYAQQYADQNYNTVYGQALQSYGTNLSTAQSQYLQSYQQYLNGLSAAQQNYGINANQNQNLFGNAMAQSQNQWNQQMALATLGEGATASGVGAGSTLGNTGANLYTQGGNAGASGIVGGANAYNQGLSNLGNLAQSYPYLSRLYASMGSGSGAPAMTVPGTQIPLGTP